MQMLVDFSNYEIESFEPLDTYPYLHEPKYIRYIEDGVVGEWIDGGDGESISFKASINVNFFKSHRVNLSAWKIRYCLDNDATRFAWADAENGKGVIYRLIDEWNNDCPYDFKNILFKRFAVTEYDKAPFFVVDNGENYYGYYYGALNLSGDQTIPEATYGEDFVWVYTFALKDLATETWHDYTILNSIGLKTDESVIITCHSNVIKEHRDEYLGEYGRKTIWLNNIVFFNCYADISSPDYADYYSYCYSNSFSNNCHSNSFGNDCYSNSFGNGCNYNSFGNACYSNSFGNDCNSNSFGNLSQSNELKAYYRYITFGEGVQHVTLLNETEGGYENQVQNYRVANGTHSEDGNPLVVDVTRNMSCETFIGIDSNDELKVFCLADLANL
jgi:hypothetical protein